MGRVVNWVTRAIGKEKGSLTLAVLVIDVVDVMNESGNGSHLTHPKSVGGIWKRSDDGVVVLEVWFEALAGTAFWIGAVVAVPARVARSGHLTLLLNSSIACFAERSLGLMVSENACSTIHLSASGSFSRVASLLLMLPSMVRVMGPM